MKKRSLAASLVLAAAALAPLAAQAQNIAVVNGKPVPKARVDAIVSQVQKQAQRARPAGAARPRKDGARQGRHRRDPEPGSRAARPRRLARVQVADGARPPEHPDRPALAGPRQDGQGQRRRHPEGIRQVQGAVQRHRVQGAPHPGREGRRGQGDRRAAQGRREVRGPREEELEGPRLGAERRRPRLRGARRRTCPSSRRR